MDSYLESLVKKGEDVATEEEAVAIEAEEVTEEVPTEPEEVAEETPVEEPDPVEEVPEVEEEPAEEEIAEEVAEEAPAVEEEIVLKAPSPVSYNVGDTVQVNDIKVYNTPDPTGPFRMITGNVIYQGQFSKCFAIDYMKPGFGLVRGYTETL